MGKNRNAVYIALAIAGFGLILYLFSVVLKSNNWMENYSLNDEEPYDLSLFKKLVDAAVKDKSEVLYTPMEELDDTSTIKTLIFMGHYMFADSLEALSILEFVKRGNTVFICSGQTPYDLLESLDSTDQIGDTEYYYDSTMGAGLTETNLEKIYSFKFRDEFGKSFRDWSHFEDSTLPGKNVETLGFFKTDAERSLDNFRRVTIGKGQLLVHTDPLLFTNFYLMENDGFEYAGKVLSYIPNQPIIWDNYHQYYHETGSSGGKTPMRFVMKHPSLKYAWYTILLSVLLFILFRSKRQQRIIPLIPRVENTSIAFAQSLGALYYQANSGRYLAIELMKLFDNFNRRKFGIKRKKDNADLALDISKSSKVPIELIESILKLERQIVYNPSSKIKDNVELFQLLDEYYKLVKK